MKKRLLYFFILFFVCLLINAKTIETNDGQIFMNATVFDKKVNGIVIKYVDENNFDCLKFINYKNLPENVQKEYGYNKVSANEYDAKHQQWLHQQYLKEEADKLRSDEMSNLIAKVQDQIQNSSIEIQFEASATVEQGSTGRCWRIYPNGQQVYEGFILLYGEEFGDSGGDSGDGESKGGSTWGGNVCPLGENIANNGEDLPCYAETGLAFQILLNREKKKLGLEDNKNKSISPTNNAQDSSVDSNAMGAINNLEKDLSGNNKQNNLSNNRGKESSMPDKSKSAEKQNKSTSSNTGIQGVIGNLEKSLSGSKGASAGTGDQSPLSSIEKELSGGKPHASGGASSHNLIGQVEHSMTGGDEDNISKGIESVLNK
jgi:hypothetical protein